MNKRRSVVVRTWSFVVLVWVLNYSFTGHAQDNPPDDLKQITEKLKFANEDSLISVFNNAKELSLVNGDTTRTIKLLIEIAKMQSGNANYPKAYDGYWEALILANAKGNEGQLAKIYSGLAILYSMFERNPEAEEYFEKSVAVNKKLIHDGKEGLIALMRVYTTYANHHRENGNYGIAQHYVDSCHAIMRQDPNIDGQYVDGVQGILLLYQGKPNQALELLLKNEKTFIGGKRAYLTILYSFLGEVCLAMNNLKRSEEYFLKSIEIADRYNRHQNFVPQVYRKLANLYFIWGKEREAYIYLLKSIDVADQYFGASSPTNRSLFEIKDEFRIETERQRQIIEQARLTELEQERSILNLKTVILSIAVAFLVVVSFTIILYLRNRHRTEKKILKSNHKLAKQNNQQILELKNKELTSFALQLIEKDELLLEIKNTLNESDKDKQEKIKRSLISKITVNRKNDWKEFDARFSSVNKSFYSALSDTYPELTKGDHKICALIKLNFSSKEMSQLLGISSESVNSSRYRIRKKMNLSKEDNLEEIICKL
ncbi:tetratricopeptide repeat protein [Reichenbachiella versicolor]|uniref:tetratricopeptide repeat protein n=1 Tax=Reichenbachiella versicolor TaxID=1821036 RepID=UPI0013A58E28|nr:tetratricopeptide repeat protein [Reichenbachiella versicolor]